MALSKGVNSYGTVAEADAYFADRLDVSAWMLADEPSKSQALVTATKIIDDIAWTGSAISVSQSLAFPRYGSYFDPRLGVSVQFTTETPLRVVNATFELAYHFLNNDGILDNTGLVDSISIGPITLTNVDAPSLMPAIVHTLIKPLRVNRGANVWWRAN